MSNSTTIEELGLALWAKTEKEHPGAFHPLLCHMIDVMSVAEQLWQTDIASGLREQLSAQTGRSEEESVKLFSLWAGLHDLGKATPSFQRKVPFHKERLEQLGFDFAIRPPQGVPHAWYTSKVLLDSVPHSDEAVRNQVLLLQIGRIIGGHHGLFPASVNLDFGPREIGRDIWNTTRQWLVSQMLLLCDLPGGEFAPTNVQLDTASCILLAGFVSICDWIGSAEDFFPFVSLSNNFEEYHSTSKKQAKDALDSLGWNQFGINHPGSLSFEELFLGYCPTPMQSSVIEIGKQPRPPELTIIEAPMGGGKTEAALFIQDQWAQSGKRPGCFFALPSQATSNQMFERMKAFLEGRYSDNRINLQLLHSRSLLSDSFQQLRLHSIHDEDQQGCGGLRGRVVAEEWFCSRKRGLLSTFGVGTVDQALLAVLQTKHFFVRLFGLASKLVIIDEVHAYDTYMSTLLKALLSWLGHLGVPVVLLSATLPRKQREELVQSYTKSDTLPRDTAYPRLTWSTGGKVHAKTIPTSHAQTIIVTWTERDAILSLLSSRLANGGCAVCICNTVRKAQNLYRTIRAVLPDWEIDILHARFPFEDRAVREDRAIARFSRDSSLRPERAVLVTTQVVEQSLDLDFDLLITDLAPVDLVLQRAGRLHRHQRSRPDGLSNPELVIVKPGMSADGVPNFSSDGYVYEEYILLRSWLVLSDTEKIKIPDQIEALIDAVYEETGFSGACDSVIAQGHEAYQKMEKRREKHQLQAKNCLVRFQADSLELFDQFNADLAEDAPGIHHQLQAMTRLAEPSITVACLFKAGDNYYLDQNQTRALDLGATPDHATIKTILRRTLSVSDRRLIAALEHEIVPETWLDSPMLRYTKPLFFESGQVCLDRLVVHLDPEVGLIIEGIRKEERD